MMSGARTKDDLMEEHRSQLYSIVALNGFLRKFSGNLGFRKHGVHCFDASGTPLLFCKPEQIEKATVLCFSRLKKDLNQADDLDSISFALAQFWYGFVLLIHPFEDGNGRTAKQIINRLLKKVEICIPDFSQVEAQTVNEDQEETLSRLARSFRESMYTL